MGPSWGQMWKSQSQNKPKGPNQDVDLEQNLEALKKQIQAILGPGRRTSEELAHERKWPKANKKKGSAIFNPSVKVNPPDASTQRKFDQASDQSWVPLREVSNCSSGTGNTKAGRVVVMVDGKGAGPSCHSVQGAHEESNSKTRRADPQTSGEMEVE